MDGREGCWSCGDFCANVPRAETVKITAFDREGNLIEQVYEGFTARIIQHEIDHLDGIRCIDRVPQDETWRLHLVDKSNLDEFNNYRANWRTWSKTFPLSDWKRFRDGLL